MKSLAKNVGDRYQSAAAMKADIDRYLAGKPVQAPGRWPRRRHHASSRRTRSTQVASAVDEPTTTSRSASAAGR